MHCIDRELIKKPSNDDNEYTMSVEGNLWKSPESYWSKSESSDRKKKWCKVERYKECEGALRYKKTNFSVFGRIF